MAKVIKRQPGHKKKVVKKKATPKKTNPKRRGGIAGRIEPIGFDDDDGICINLYGRSGTGKTTLWATFPKPILVAVCSGLKKPGELRSINTAQNRKDIKQFVIKKTDDVRQLVDYMQETRTFATVVLDHASALQDMTIKEIMGMAELPVQGSWGMATQQDWGQCAMQMKGMLRALLSLDCNRVIIAQERDFNTDTETDLLMPFVASALTPSVAGWLAPACDYVCQTFMRPKTVEKTVRVGRKNIVKKSRVPGKIEYCLRTGPHDVFTTKFRMPNGSGLPEVLVDPTYAKIRKLIQAGGQ